MLNFETIWSFKVDFQGFMFSFYIRIQFETVISLFSSLTHPKAMCVLITNTMRSVTHF